MARGDGTSIAAGADQAVKHWLSGVQREKMKDMFLSESTGKVGSGAVIIRRDDLKKQAGDIVSFDLTPRITDVPVKDDGWLRQAESQLTFYADTVTIGVISYAHYVLGKLSDQRVVHDLFKTGRTSIVTALKEQIETWMVKKLSGQSYKALPYTTAGTAGTATEVGEAGTTNTNFVYPDGVSAVNELTTESYFALSLINKCVRDAKNGPTNGYQMKVPKGGMWSCFITPNAEYWLETQDANWKNAMLYAQVRGNGNPLFKDVSAVWKNTKIRTHDNLYTASTGGAEGNLDYSYALFLGAEAGVLADVTQLGVSPFQVDYFKAGLGVRAMMGFDKTTFNSKDWATIAVPTYNGTI